MTTVPLSAINHYLYCQRRAALIHVERMFVENEHTLTGTAAHEHVDFPGYEMRRGIRLLRALPLYSECLGLSGKADLVEEESVSDGSKVYRPIEYKKGPKRKFSNDLAQLCAQAMCLEEMFGCEVRTGAVFYVKSQTRETVEFSQATRDLVRDSVVGVRGLIERSLVPTASLKPQCEGCSMHESCFPESERSKVFWTLKRKALFALDSDLS